MMLIFASDVAAQSGIDFVSLIRMAVAIVSMIAGMFFVFVGTIGVLRLPDFFTRVHAAGMLDTLGVELILLGLIVQSGFTQMSLKLLLVALFLFLTSPTSTHAVAHAAYKAGLKPYLGPFRAPDPSVIRDRMKAGDT